MQTKFEKITLVNKVRAHKQRRTKTEGPSMKHAARGATFTLKTLSRKASREKNYETTREINVRINEFLLTRKRKATTQKGKGLRDWTCVANIH